MGSNFIPQVEYAGVTCNSLRGKSVIVTGGATSIGSDIVRGFAGQGCRVGFLDCEAAASKTLAERACRPGRSGATSSASIASFPAG